MRGIRGATSIESDNAENVAAATREMLQAIVARNVVNLEDVAAATFSTTTDVTSAFPATAARAIGWSQVPMLCHHELAVPGSLPHCIRVLVLWNTDKRQDEIQHVYLREAVRLRPDLADRRAGD
jgi:chorismate mutase